jgi:hypothetical protein
VSSHSLGMGAVVVTSTNVIVDTDLLAVGSAEFAVGNSGPSWFAIREFGWSGTVTIVFPDWVAILTTEEAAGQVR